MYVLFLDTRGYTLFDVIWCHCLQVSIIDGPGWLPSKKIFLCHLSKLLCPFLELWAGDIVEVSISARAAVCASKTRVHVYRMRVGCGWLGSIRDRRGICRTRVECVSLCIRVCISPNIEEELLRERNLRKKLELKKWNQALRLFFL